MNRRASQPLHQAPANPVASAVTLYIHYPNRRYVLTTALAEGQELSIFAPTQARLPVGAPVRLAIDFGDVAQRFSVTGTVSYLRGPRYGASEQLGLGVAFRGDDKKTVAEMLAFCSGKPLEQGTATKRRVPTQIRCRVDSGKYLLSAEVLDLSTAGLFIATPKNAKLKVGSEITVQLEPGFFGLGGQKVDVRIMWQGEKSGAYGFGARFVGDVGSLNPFFVRHLKPSQVR
ncbi:MAG: PilZ domain-containing protein [Myxococcaceae bacterium]